MAYQSWYVGTWAATVHEFWSIPFPESNPGFLNCFFSFFVFTVSPLLLFNFSTRSVGDGTSMILGTGMRPHGWNAKTWTAQPRIWVLIKFYKILIFLQNFDIRFDSENSRIQAETCFNGSNQCQNHLFCLSYSTSWNMWNSHSLTAPNPPGVNKSNRNPGFGCGTERPPSRSQHLFLDAEESMLQSQPFLVFQCVHLQASIGLLKKKRNMSMSRVGPSSMSGTGGA